jgi:hypothetical protein
MSAARPWPLATLVFGLGTLAVLIAFSLLPEVKAAYPGGDFGQQLSAFQRATTMADLSALFGDPADAAKLRAMTAGNTLDLYVFIPVYALFLISAAAMLAGGASKRIAWFAIAAVLIGAAADVVETSTQLHMSLDWSQAEALLPRVAPGCWIKYFGLAVHALGCTLICFAGDRKRPILGVGGVLPILGVAADWAGLIHLPTLMTAVFGVFWLALIGIAAAELVRKRV